MKKLVSNSRVSWIMRTVIALTILIIAAHGAAAQWATNGTNINNTNTGNVGVGTTSPVYSLDVNGGTNAFRTKASTSNSNDTIATFESSSGITAIFRANGFFGIGTTSPTRPLQVSAADGETARFYRPANGADYGVNIRFSLNNSSGALADYAGVHGQIASNAAGSEAGNLLFTTATGGSLTEKMRITSGGHVGIGTTSPVFDVNGSVSKYFTMDAGAGTLASFGVGSNITNTSYPVGQMAFFNSSLGTTEKRLATIVGQTTNATNNGALAFWAASSGSFVAPTMFMTATNVGIGTTSPTALLDMSGGLRLRQNPGGNAAASLIEMGDRHPGWGMGFTWNLYFDGSAWKNRSTDYGAILGFGDGTNQGDLLFWNSPSTGAGSTPSLTERFRITNSGNVGIGINPNSSYKLDVNGEINATGFRINGTPISSGGSQWTGSSSISYSGGNVGIGNSSPNVLLDLNGNNASYGGQLRIAATDYDQITFYNSNNLTLGASGRLGSLYYAVGYSRLDINNHVASAPIILQDPNDSGGGNVGIGVLPNANYKLDVAGNINSSATITGSNIVAKYQDVAEWVPSSEQLSAATVVVLDATRSNEVIASTQAYDTRVAGVVSSQPGITLGEKSDTKVLVATTGRVRVKVDASRAPINIGDLLVTSDISGVAMKSEPVEFAGRRMHMPGTIIGKALEPLRNGSGEILVLLSLQ